MSKFSDALATLTPEQRDAFVAQEKERTHQLGKMAERERNRDGHALIVHDAEVTLAAREDTLEMLKERGVDSVFLAVAERELRYARQRLEELLVEHDRHFPAKELRVGG